MITCQKCGTENQETHKFCMKCGNNLEIQAQQVPQPEVEEIEEVEIVAPEQDQLVEDQAETEPELRAPAAVIVEPEETISKQEMQDEIKPRDYPAQVKSQPEYPQQQQERPVYQPAPGYSQRRETTTYPQPRTMPTMMATESTILGNIWGPFAGYGTRMSHIGWLMDGKGARAEELRTSVDERFSQRQIPQASLYHKDLTAKGLLSKKRRYFLLQRELVTVGLYITQFGKDLFISMASYLKPPISTFKVFLLLGMTLFAFYFLFLFPSRLGNSFANILGGFLGSGGDPTPFFGLACIIGPLGTLNFIALFVFLIYSLYKYFSDKDFLAGLRVQPNEFNEDDLMAMEKAVEQTTRQAIDMIGLDPDDLRPIRELEQRRVI